MRFIMKSGATVSVSVLVYVPTTAITFDIFVPDSLQGWMKSLTEMRLKTPGKFCVSEQWSKRL